MGKQSTLGVASSQFWWSMLCNVPSSPDSLAYKRLKRVWFDHTWPGHPFADWTHENHSTATLWENFAIFPPTVWVPVVLEAAGLCAAASDVQECAWSYEFETTGGGKKIADVAHHVRDRDGDLVIVVEAKTYGGKLKTKDTDLPDTDPGSYLDRDAFRSFSDRRFMIYLIDERDKASVQDQIIDTSVQGQIIDDHKRHGIITWQELGGIQIGLTTKLDADPNIQAFVAGAIQFQFLLHGIKPNQLAASYLQGELPFEQINKDNPQKQSTSAREESLWKLHP